MGQINSQKNIKPTICPTHLSQVKSHNDKGLSLTGIDGTDENLLIINVNKSIYIYLYFILHGNICPSVPITCEALILQRLWWDR